MMDSDPSPGFSILWDRIPPANQTEARTEEGDLRQAEDAMAAGAQSAASSSATMKHIQGSSFAWKESNTSPQRNTEWPADWFIEAPRAIHQDWNIDLNTDYIYHREERQAVGLNQDNIYVGEDIVHEHCSDESGSESEEEIDWQQDESTCVEELFPVPDEEDMDEAPLEDKAAMARTKRSKVAKANAIKSAGHKAVDLKKLVDRAAYAFDKHDFDVAMEELKKEDQAAWEWMCKIPTEHWARHALDTHCKTDLIVNNLSEVFNSYILKVRDKPIVTMIDSIRSKLMPRFATKREGVEQAQWEITPTYAERLEWEKRNARWCTNIVCSKKNLWQVTHIERTYEVNLAERTCGCFKWDLTGIPCKHVVSAIYKAKEFPEDYVSDFFKKPMYKEAYKNLIYPVPGQHGWTKTDSPDIDPPEYDTKRGRKQKKRRRGQHESSKPTVQNRMTTIQCSNCKLHGHRYTNCVQPLKPHLAIRKAQHKTVRRLPEDGAPPPAPRRNSGSAPEHHPSPPQAPAAASYVSHPPPHESNVIGRTQTANGSRFGVQGYEGGRLYSYFTAGLNYQANAQQE